MWNLFDFAADGRDEGGKHGVNQKGLVTMDRKLKKDAFYLYKAHWSKEPFVHMCGRRYKDRAGDRTTIKVYSNQPEVTLYRDGVRMESKKAEFVFEFSVSLVGEHTFEARAGECTDAITIRKVKQPNPAYRYLQDGGIVNWFDKEDFREDYFSIQDTLGDLLANPGTAPIVGRLMAQAQASRGDVAKATSGNKALEAMMAKMSLQSLLKQAGDAVKPEQVKALNAALQKVKK